MNYKKIEIKEGISVHEIETEQFKTNLLALFITVPLKKENVTKEALIPAVLRRGTSKHKTLEEISKKLEEMYGASFNCGIEKTGDNHVIKVYLETINDAFLPEKENLLKDAIDTLLEIILEPLVENNEFKKEYVESEKSNLKTIIEGKKDNKAQYALEKCIEEMYKDEPYGLYKYGSIEELEKINSKELYEYYQELIKKCKIDIFVSGKDIENAKNIIQENENIKKLQPRKKDYIIDSSKKTNMDEQIKTIEENMELTQGKLVLGLDIVDGKEEEKYTALIYNAILGGTANSKLFQNVREKASLAYTAGSSYLRQKNNIFIKCGIEIKNYEKALQIIKEQLETMKNGDFSEDDIQNAKSIMISTIKAIPDEQDTGITYYFGQEFSHEMVEFEEYINRVNKVNKEDIVKLANKIKINTIYFLK